MNPPSTHTILWVRLGDFLRDAVITAELSLDAISSTVNENKSALVAVNWASHEGQNTEQLIARRKELNVLYSKWKEIDAAVVYDHKDRPEHNNALNSFRKVFSARLMKILRQEPYAADNEIHAAIKRAHHAGQQSALSDLLDPSDRPEALGFCII